MLSFIAVRNVDSIIYLSIFIYHLFTIMVYQPITYFSICYLSSIYICYDRKLGVHKTDDGDFTGKTFKFLLTLLLQYLVN